MQITKHGIKLARVDHAIYLYLLKPCHIMLSTITKHCKRFIQIVTVNHLDVRTCYLKVLKQLQQDTHSYMQIDLNIK